MAEQTKKRLMTTDTTSKISENPNKKKQIRRSDEGKQSKKETNSQWGHCLDLWEVWSRNYHLLPLGAAKENETEILGITTLIDTVQTCALQISANNEWRHDYWDTWWDWVLINEICSTSVRQVKMSV